MAKTVTVINFSSVGNKIKTERPYFISNELIDTLC